LGSTQCPAVAIVEAVSNTVEAVGGGVVGPLDAPEALVLGRADERGRLRVVGRTPPLTLPARREVGAVLTTDGAERGGRG
jgi:hypothetical protein